MSRSKSSNRKLRKLLGPQWRTIMAGSNNSFQDWMNVAKDRRNEKKIKPEEINQS